SANDVFRFVPATGDLNAEFKLTPGLHTIIVSVRNACGTDNMGVNVNIKEPCLPPKVSFTVNEVNRDDVSHELRGSVSGVKNRSDISITVNGSTDDGFQFVPATGDLNAKFKLTPGSHTIVVSVTNACGSDNQDVSVIMKEPCIPPKVSFTVNEVNRDEASHELRGSVSNVKSRSDISFIIDRSASDGFRFDPASGDLIAGFNLPPGSHSIIVSVTNTCGSDNQGVTVIMEEPCIPPKVSFTVSEVNRDDASHELRGSISNVNDKSGISLTVNGSTDDGFRFDPASGDLNGSFKLTPGTHTIVVSVSNACGSDNQGASINIEQPCIPPRVSITVNEVNRDDASHELSGSISNVKNKADISLTVDGSADDGFQFVPATGDLNAKFNLTPGPHTIIVSATNACGADNQGVNINIEEPCLPPKVSFTISEVNRDDASHELSGSVSNVKDRAGISLTVNGNADNDFQFVPATSNLNAKFKLAPGSHTIIISVTNACGTDNQGVSVIMEEPCIPPKVSFTLNEVNRDDASHELKGSISNVKDRAGISLTVNGSADNGFQFVPTTGDLNAKFKLTPGLHTIFVSVTNACGTDNQEVSVNIAEPCIPPKVSFTVNEVKRDDASHELSGSISNVKDRAGISLTVNDNADNGFQFDPATGDLNAKFKLTPGSHTIVISVTNECGSDNQEVSVIMEEPCIPPKVSFTVSEVNRDDASHELSGSISNVKNKADISLTVDDSADDGFQFVPETGDLNAKFKLKPGSHTIVVSVTNACGSDNQNVSVIMEDPCIPPKVSFTVNEVNRDDASHELSGSISNVKNKADISLTLNGNVDNGFQFVPGTGELNAKFKLTPGTHMIVVSVTNACGSDNQGVSVIMEEPCIPPKVSFTLSEVNRDDASHELSGSISNVKNKADISLTVDGSADDGFQFVPATGVLNAKFKLTSGSHTIVVSANNECGTDSKSEPLSIEEKACGVRINPGNSSWQFCMVTPSGTFSRENLTNENFSYSGPATSLYFMPIAGGGDVMVNGSPYAIQSGQYYLFTGNLDVTVGTKNPGSMGHWSVCISADSEPVYGKGNNRPESPCEEEEDDGKKGKGNK
ncbi:hypothetical protein ACFLTA_06720, partial [Bacteroidota bacterium]